MILCFAECQGMTTAMHVAAEIEEVLVVPRLEFHTFPYATWCLTKIPKAATISSRSDRSPVSCYCEGKTTSKRQKTATEYVVIFELAIKAMEPVRRMGSLKLNTAYVFDGNAATARTCYTKSPCVLMSIQ